MRGVEMPWKCLLGSSGATDLVRVMVVVGERAGAVGPVTRAGRISLIRIRLSMVRALPGYVLSVPFEQDGL